MCVYVYVEVPARFRAYKEALRCAYRVCGMVIAVRVIGKIGCHRHHQKVKFL